MPRLQTVSPLEAERNGSLRIEGLKRPMGRQPKRQLTCTGALNSFSHLSWSISISCHLLIPARKWSLPFELVTSTASSHLLQSLECMGESLCSSSHLLIPCKCWGKRRKPRLHSSSRTFKTLRSSKRGYRSKLFSKSPRHT